MRRGAPVAALLALALCAGRAGAGEVGGRITLGIEGARLVDLGPTVVFLEGTAATGPAPAPHRRIRQHNARFEPDFLVVAAGDSVEMANDDAIFHNVFSFSRPNDFDLGVYPAGESRRVTFEHAGLVRIYCSIHESMSAAIVVAPSPWFSRASASGEYRIAAVPPGRYRLTVWNEKLPAAGRSIEVRSGSAVQADVVLGATAP